MIVLAIYLVGCILSAIMAITMAIKVCKWKYLTLSDAITICIISFASWIGVLGVVIGFLMKKADLIIIWRKKDKDEQH